MITYVTRSISEALEKTSCRVFSYTVLVLIMSQLGAIVDFLAHPDLPYLDHEHLLVGVAAALVTLTFVVGLERFVLRRRELETRLREAWSRAYDYFDIAGVMLVVLNVDETISVINAKGCAIFGCTREELIGKNWFDTCIPARDREALRAAFRSLLSGDGESCVFFENAMVTKSGDERMIAWHHTVLRDTSGRPTGTLSSGDDVTDRKRAEDILRRSEEKYRDLFENANDAIFVLDADSNYIDVNKKATELFGFSKEEFLGMNVMDVAPPGQALRSEDEFRKLRARGAYEKFIGKMRRKDGGYADIEVSSSLILAGGTIVGSRDIVRDITDRVRSEEDLLRAQKLESLGVLAGGIAHDFRNLLMAIMGNVDLALLSLEPRAPAHAQLEKAEKAILRAKGLTDQLLTFSKGGAPVRQLLSLKAVIREAAEFATAGSNIRPDLYLAEDLWPVEADEGQLSQALYNIIINAVQAMQQGGVVMARAANERLVPISAIPLPPGNYVRIEIIDQGAGIPEDQLSKIFDPYVTTKQHGSGLGLATAYTIVKKHGGHISVQSTIAAGATFIILLPARPGIMPVQEQPRGELPRGTGRVLVMDDEDEVREAACEMVKRLGYAAEPAADGEEALRCYQEAMASGRPFSAVLMDLTVRGGMGGVEATQKLLAMDPSARAIVSSGYSHDPVMADYRQFGFRAVVAKPYRLRDLAAALNQATDG